MHSPENTTSTKRALSWSRAAAIAGRDLKSAPGKFAFVVLSVAVGVAALVGVRGLRVSFRGTLSGQARSRWAGDVGAGMPHTPTDGDRAKPDARLRQSPVMSEAWTTETV